MPLLNIDYIVFADVFLRFSVSLISSDFPNRRLFRNPTLCLVLAIQHLPLTTIVTSLTEILYFFFYLSDYLIPFRKSKRVRTAFSPSQLLKLEHAFESNHYVVGAERKQLAQNLNLSETQVIIGTLS